MSYFHYIFLYLVIGILPSAPFVFIYLYFSKQELKDISKLYLFILFMIVGWLTNEYMTFF